MYCGVDSRTLALLGSWLKLYLVMHFAFRQSLHYLDFKVWSLSLST
jgi:hypothetical protein